MPSPADGSLESISVKEGDTVQVGALLGAIAEGAKGKASATPAKNPQAAAPKPAPAPAPRAKVEPPKRLPSPPRLSLPAAPVMPATRRIAEESGVDLSTVAGTGRDGPAC
ncbi:MAG: E3 binding domain-containing protein [Rhizomicrobium sp.]